MAMLESLTWQVRTPLRYLCMPCLHPYIHIYTYMYVYIYIYIYSDSHLCILSIYYIHNALLMCLSSPTVNTVRLTGVKPKSEDYHRRPGHR